ncbi:hypothetical protein C1I63_07725 [Rathayibacter caricis DSM 15933]|uniref:Uncharacterized protein n=1 Tax=Rathayibacter caricis DSM 15933 TaxID=1328867 RepID=A0A2T4UTA1_9MICO|nr:hypothetical protein C1I63_07725 [Rathayibacter caricis DSM 15933]
MGAIASSEVAEARRWSIPAHATSIGTITMPPPTPNAPESTPPITPMRPSSRYCRPRRSVGSTGAFASSVTVPSHHGGAPRHESRRTVETSSA